jgi:deoxyribose-phosphate aldolase
MNYAVFQTIQHHTKQAFICVGLKVQSIIISKAYFKVQSVIIYTCISVATGFPTGQTALKTRLEEIRMAVEDGAREIDIVINRQMALTGDWKGQLIYICNNSKVDRKTVVSPYVFHVSYCSLTVNPRVWKLKFHCPIFC